MAGVRAAWRLLRALLLALRGWATIRFEFPRLSEAQREERVQAWARRMLAVLGIALQVRGQPAVRGPVLLVSNHISWLDILVLHAARHCRFVSKSDVKRWPLIGALATGAGTLYIERESRRDAMRVVHHMAASLKSGDILAVFPEGTTSDGIDLLPFHANLVQAAVSAPAPAQPVALQFIETHTGRMSLEPCYIGDDTLVASLWRTLTGPPITAVVSFGAPQHANGRDRRAWAADLRAAVQRLRQEG
ncbi:lysophospholipid acyltransferase family protein [Ramlibacter tataouinensis]|uniref:lysophospholipid acyltransferase family protein n=1 Tax=Ramlibacter tataouinensis TaxID=94132 RepID=UPI0022F38D4D|nr:lysophospholipid acyltransferase family protein [Ramlibacter tataouinensis]WBY03702.1 lysophospholipid acyltransferase family protein [Ramlibacter tataouinensis]